MRPKLFMIIVAIMTTFFSCNMDDNPVPDVRVDFYVNFNNAQYSALQNPGGWVYLTGGYAGIFLYNFDNTTFYAYDRACTLDYTHAPLVYDERSHCLIHQDTVENCSSRYNVILQGAVSHGDAKFALRQYDVLVYDGYLHILNGLYE